MPKARGKSRSDRSTSVAFVKGALCALFHIFFLSWTSQSAANSPNSERIAALRALKIAPTSPFVEIDTARQKLTLFALDRPIKIYSVSTSARGVGQILGSLQTPRGLHRICRKFGGGHPPLTIFRARKSIGKQWSCQDPERLDFILTRILALEGLQRGINRGCDAQLRCIDSRARCIYLHGTHQEHKIGVPASHGCIRMRNSDIIELFDRLPCGTQVWID